MRVRLLKTVLDVQGVPYFPDDVVEAEWRGGQMYVTQANYLPLQAGEWEPVVPDTMPKDLIAEEG